MCAPTYAIELHWRCHSQYSRLSTTVEADQVPAMRVNLVLASQPCPHREMSHKPPEAKMNDGKWTICTWQVQVCSAARSPKTFETKFSNRSTQTVRHIVGPWVCVLASVCLFFSHWYRQEAGMKYLTATLVFVSLLLWEFCYGRSDVYADVGICCVCVYFLTCRKCSSILWCIFIYVV